MKSVLTASSACSSSFLRSVRSAPTSFTSRIRTAAVPLASPGLSKTWRTMEELFGLSLRRYFGPARGALARVFWMEELPVLCIPM